MAIMVPRNALAPLLRNVDASLFRPVRADSPALDLLLRYMDLIYGKETLAALMESEVSSA